MEKWIKQSMSRGRESSEEKMHLQFSSAQLHWHMLECSVPDSFADGLVSQILSAPGQLRGISCCEDQLIVLQGKRPVAWEVYNSVNRPECTDGAALWNTDQGGQTECERLFEWARLGTYKGQKWVTSGGVTTLGWYSSLGICRRVSYSQFLIHFSIYSNFSYLLINWGNSEVNFKVRILLLERKKCYHKFGLLFIL